MGGVTMWTVRQLFSNIWKHRSLLKSQRLILMTTNKLNTEQYVGWHDDEKCAFHLKLGDKTVTDIAVLEYRWVRDGVADLFHTEVPTAYRGKGIAKILAQTALDYMVQQDAKIILSCSYLAKYVQDNPLPKYIERVLDES